LKFWWYAGLAVVHGKKVSKIIYLKIIKIRSPFRIFIIFRKYNFWSLFAMDYGQTGIPPELQKVQVLFTLWYAGLAVVQGKRVLYFYYFQKIYNFRSLFAIDYGQTGIPPELGGETPLKVVSELLKHRSLCG